MSAYIMDQEDINSIVNYFSNAVMQSTKLWVPINGQYDYLTKANAAEVARILFAENVRSVDTRYSEENDSRFSFKPSYNSKTEKEVAQLIDSLEYQSCETDDYYQTEAYRIICCMRKQLLQNIFAEEIDYQELAMWTN